MSCSTALRRHGWFRYAAALVGLCACTSAGAGPTLPYNQQYDDSKFGKIKQSVTNFPNGGCGPVATANSFRYLQNVYYGPQGKTFVAGTENDNLVAVANSLGTGMGTSDTKGTSVAGLVKGKNAYARTALTGQRGDPPDELVYDPELDMTFRVILGAFSIAAIQLDPWNPDDEDRGPPGPPPEVKVGTPTLNLLMQLVKRKYDIELLLRVPNEDRGHWVTVVGLTVTAVDEEDGPDTYEGSLRYIDPETGTIEKSNIFADTLTSVVSADYNGDVRQVTGYAVEVPVPGTFAVAVIAVAWTGHRRRR